MRDPSRTTIHVPLTPARRRMRWVEMFVLFVAPPMAMLLNGLAIVFPALWLGGALVLTLLVLDPTFNRRALGHFRPSRKHWKRMLLTFVFAAAILTTGTFLFLPDRFLALPLNKPILWAIIMIAYPVLSVYPQELIFRTFFFHRYQPLFKNQSTLIILSATFFALAHIIFGHWLSVALTFIAGLLFAYTYARARSTFLVVVEHALYGCFVFTIGMGALFYTGARHQPPPPDPASHTAPAATLTPHPPRPQSQAPSAPAD